jgi:hypothetical protein
MSELKDEPAGWKGVVLKCENCLRLEGSLHERTLKYDKVSAERDQLRKKLENSIRAALRDRDDFLIERAQLCNRVKELEAELDKIKNGPPWD